MSKYEIVDGQNEIRELERRGLSPRDVFGDDCDETLATTPEQNLLETAWGLICNAGGGNWNLETEEWQKATKKYREAYFAYLKDKS